MTYNKTKRNLEKASGIIGVIEGALKILFSFISFIVGCLISVSARLVTGVFSAIIAGATPDDQAGKATELAGKGIALLGLPVILSSIVLFAFSICAIVFAAKMIKNPMTKQGLVKRKGAQITHIVFSFLVLNIVAAILEIIAICMKDYVDGPDNAQTTKIEQPPIENNEN